MRTDTLTKRQRQVLSIIEKESKKTGQIPSLHAIAAELDINVNGVVGHMKALERKGFVFKGTRQTSPYSLAPVSKSHFKTVASGSSGKADRASERSLYQINEHRSADPTQPDGRVVGFEMTLIPFMAEIAAGYAKSAVDQYDRQVEFSPRFFGAESVVAVKVVGDSMSGDAIAEGDIAMIAIQKDFNKNDILALRINGEEVTLKRINFIQHKGQNICELLPSNPNFPKVCVPAHQVDVIGKMVGLIRKV